MITPEQKEDIVRMVALLIADTAATISNDARERAERLVSLASTLYGRIAKLGTYDAVRTLAVTLSATTADGGGSEAAGEIMLAAPTSTVELQSMLTDLGKEVSGEDVLGWSPDQRAEVEAWVTAQQMHAGDTVPYPSVLE